MREEVPKSVACEVGILTNETRWTFLETRSKRAQITSKTKMTDNTSGRLVSSVGDRHSAHGKGVFVFKDGPDKATRWLPRDDVILADALVQQKNIGKNRDGAVFSMESWNQVAEQLKGSELTSGGGPKNVVQCKARWQRVSGEDLACKAPV